MRARLLKFLLAVALLAAAPAFAAQDNIYEKTLPNGLKVIVREDHRAPTVVQQVWYHVGSIDETTGTTGIAHVLEHMMFKGTKNVPVGEFSRRIAAAGGRENAFTNSDYTAYFQQLHKSKLELAMRLESDRMRYLQLSGAEFDKEIQVVMEERRMRTDDQPRSVLYESLLATAFVEHPYHNPVIGWMDDLHHITVDDARHWYESWYAPNNATLVVAGDVKAADVFKLAERYYGPIPSRKLPVRKPLSEPPQAGIKRIVVKAPAELPYLMMAYHAPALRDPQNDWKPYALDVLVGVLNGNDSARLDKALVRDQQIATEISADYDSTSRGPSLFMLSGTPSAGKTVADLEAGLREQIALLVKNGVSEDELKRVKAQVTAGEVYKLDSVFYQAMQIGQMESIGLGYKAIPLRLEKIKAVTAQQVQDVARELLQDDNLSVAVLDPQPISDNRKHSDSGASNNVR